MADGVNIGTLDTLVTIQEYTVTRSSQGAKSYTPGRSWSVYGNVDLSINEQVSIGNLEEGQYINLTIYKIPALTTRWQVTVEGRHYEITGINPIDRLSNFCVLSLHALD